MRVASATQSDATAGGSVVPGIARTAVMKTVRAPQTSCFCVAFAGLKDATRLLSCPMSNVFVLVGSDA